jgi:hypothetical protein
LLDAVRDLRLVKLRQQDHRVDAKPNGEQGERPQGTLVGALERRRQRPDRDDPVVVLGLAAVELDLVDHRGRRPGLLRPDSEGQRCGEQQGGEHGSALTFRASTARRRRGTAGAPAG